MQYARMKSESKRLRDNLLTSFRCHIDSGVLWQTNKGHGMLLKADNVDVYAYPYTHIHEPASFHFLKTCFMAY